MEVYSFYPHKPIKKPFYEREWFKNLMCCVLLILAMAFAGIAGFVLYAACQ